MTIQTLRVRNLDATENEFASRDQRVNVVTNANMNHAQTIKPARSMTKVFPL
jgi:hypothetical protein